jgi:hypothetical protein
MRCVDDILWNGYLFDLPDSLRIIISFKNHQASDEPVGERIVSKSIEERL